MVRKELCDKFEDVPLGGGMTYNAHPVSLAAALANIEIYEEQHLVENSAKMGERMYKGLLELAKEHPSIDYISGKDGLFHGIQCVPELCDEEKGKLIMAALKEHRLTTMGKNGHFMICPALVISAEEVDYVLSTLDDVMTYVDTLLDKSQLLSA